MSEETIPPPPSPPVPQPSPRAAPAAMESRLAVLSFTCGWLLTAIPAVICGHIAWSKVRKSGGALRGKGIATAGLTLGYIGLALGVMGIPLLADDRWSSHLARRIKRDGKQNQCRFSSYYGGRRRLFSTNSCLDAEVALGSTESIATRNYRNVS
jgi:hypothetical protein